MPDAPFTPPLAFDTVDEIADATRRAGGRVSPARRELLEVLFASDEPMSAEALADALSRRGVQMELSSVYRSLEHLERLGAARHVHIGHGPGLYALTGRDEREYLSCARCGRVTTVDAITLDPARAMIRDITGYEARFTHFPIVGLCAACSGEDKRA